MKIQPRTERGPGPGPLCKNTTNNHVVERDFPFSIHSARPTNYSPPRRSLPCPVPLGVCIALPVPIGPQPRPSRPPCPTPPPPSASGSSPGPFSATRSPASRSVSLWYFSLLPWPRCSRYSFSFLSYSSPPAHSRRHSTRPEAHHPLVAHPHLSAVVWPEAVKPDEKPPPGRPGLQGFRLQESILSGLRVVPGPG